MIDHWRLKRDANSHAFAVYHRSLPGERISLVVSGIGKVNAAAACAHLYQTCTPQRAVWINVGIAGHGLSTCGETLIAHSIEDQSNGNKYYPPLLFKSPCPSTHLISVDVVSEHYPENAAIDMEASAFFATANKYTTAEFVQSIKVISDNRENPLDSITTEWATGLIRNAIGDVQQVVDSLLQLASNLDDPVAALPDFVESFRLSTSQQTQFKALMQRWSALNPDAPFPTLSLDGIKSARELLHRLSTLLDEQSISYRA